MLDANENIGYAGAVDAYWNAGWRSPLPLHPRTKFPPPPFTRRTDPDRVSYTGYDGIDPSYPDIMSWAEEFREGNLCLRLPGDVIGIDVDAYGAKTGAATFVEACRRWGPLPKGPRSTSRASDLTSGIRLFRVPTGTHLETIINFPELGVGDIEVIQRHHRYVVAWPSVHPEGGRYHWVDEYGEMAAIPAVADLPELPSTWIEGLKVQPRAMLDDNTIRYDVRQVMTTGDMSVQVHERLRQAIKELNIPGASRHDTCNRHVMALARLGKNGQPGVEHAMRLLCDVLKALRAADGSDKLEDPRTEFIRMLVNDNLARELSKPGITDWVAALVVEDLQVEQRQPLPNPQVEQRQTPGNDSGPSAEVEGPEANADSSGAVIVDDSASIPPLLAIERGFWQARESLAMIYQTALAQMASPWATLGICAARALTQVRPHVVLPPIIGGPGSLNLFVALVARSGGGKGAAGGAANILIPDAHFVQKNLGSGEGLVRLFDRPKNDDGSDNRHEALLINVDEVDILTSLNQRTASTTTSVLRSAFSGETLGFSYVNRAGVPDIGAHSYRMTLVVSVQPERAGGLLADKGGGTPQRFMWFPAEDPRVSMDERWPSGPLTLPKPGEWLYPREIVVPDETRYTIKSERVKAMQGNQEALDGHALFCREKFAYALAVLDGRTQMTLEDWELSGVASNVSAYARELCRGELKDAARIDAIDRGEIRGIEMHAADESKELEFAEKTRRVLRKLIDRLTEAGPEGLTARELTHSFNSRDRKALQAAYEIGQSNGLIALLNGTTKWVRL